MCRVDYGAVLSKSRGGRIEEAGSQLLTTSSTLGCPGSWISCARQDQDQDQDQGWTRALEMPRSWSTWIRHAPFAQANVRQGPRGSTLIDDASRGSTNTSYTPVEWSTDASRARRGIQRQMVDSARLRMVYPTHARVLGQIRRAGIV